MASLDKFRAIPVADSDICLHIEHVSETLHSVGKVQLTCACQIRILESKRRWCSLSCPPRVSFTSYYIYQISWGTKQDAIPDADLGAAVQDSHSQVDIKMLAEAADVNGIYEEALESLRAAKFADVASARGSAKTKQGAKGKTIPKAMSEREKEQAAMDYYANVRTNVLLTWVLSNVSGNVLSSRGRCLVPTVGADECLENAGRAPLADPLRYGYFEHIQLGRGCVANQGIFDVHSCICGDHKLCGEFLFVCARHLRLICG